MSRATVYFWVSVALSFGLATKGEILSATIMLCAAMYCGLHKSEGK